MDGFDVRFREVQKFSQIWLWIVNIGSVLFMFGIMTLVTKEAINASGKPDIPQDLIWGWILAVFFSFLMIGLFVVANMVTEVREDGIYVRLFPFHRTFRRLPFETLKSYEVRTYDPIGEYGGWGIRGFRGNMAYNVRGNQGVQLEFQDGRRLLIGSQKPEELCMAIDTAAKQIV